MLLAIAAGAFLALLLILPARGIMNAVNRIDYVSQRLDDYPRMQTFYQQEKEEIRDWWVKEVFDECAGQAAVIFSSDQKHGSEEEKLSYIAEVLNAEKAQAVSEAECRTITQQDAAAGLYTCSAPMEDGRRMVLSFLSSEINDRTALAEDNSSVLSQIEAGLPGYICVVKNGVLSVYPKDEKEEELRGLIGSMLENRSLDPAAQRERAVKNRKKTELAATVNRSTSGIPTGKYFLYSAAYTEIDDYVINVTDTATLFRFGRKRSWALWFLTAAIFFLLGQNLWKTRLYQPGTEAGEEFRTAVKKSISAMFITVLLLLSSVFVIQMLSGVNLAQQGATDLTQYLKRALDQESERAGNIEKEFDGLYLSRAQTAARVLSDDPQLIEADSLYGLDRSLGGSGLYIFSADGTPLASDRFLHSAIDFSMVSLSSGSREALLEDETDAEEEAFRYYRAVMTNEQGKMSGWAELRVPQRELDVLLAETSLKEVIGDLHILDTLHAVAVEKGPEGRILASTWKNWVGEPAEDHGIQTEYLYDDYEGIVNFDGNKCYSAVFGYGPGYVIVGSENETLFVFIGGVLILTYLLALIALLAVYRTLVRIILEFQKEEFAVDKEGAAYAARNEYPVIKDFLRDFMIAVFLLSSVLFFTTKGNPAGLTYNIVRGTWVRGVNAATITTCIMLASVVCAVQRLIDVVLLHLGKYLSPKGMTICRLLDSALTYLGMIVMIIYTLSMFGVNTATLVGGVGATALIFTLGANSLIADVLAGMFIIFEGDFTVGDVVVINDFRGIVTDISMRTTKLMDDNSRDIKIINNSTIVELTNQSRENSSVIVDISISRSIGLEKGEAILKEAIRKLPEMYPKIIGTPEYWGVSKLPEKNKYSGKLGGPKARIAFDCLEKDKEMLTYQVYRSLVGLVNDLSGAPSPSEGEQK